MPKNLQLTFDSLLAFQRDLEARGLADRVLVLVWSEFGRRAAENGSGTDHGAAGLGFLIGTRASGRMIGEFPGLEKLDDLGIAASPVPAPEPVEATIRALRPAEPTLHGDEEEVRNGTTG